MTEIAPVTEIRPVSPLHCVKLVTYLSLYLALSRVELKNSISANFQKSGIYSYLEFRHV